MLALAVTLALAVLLVPAIGTVVFAQDMGGMGGNMTGNMTGNATGNDTGMLGGLIGNITGP
jgi:hypothetical protein